MDQKEPVTRWWDFSAAILLLAAILTAATRLISTQWTENLSIIQTLAFLGVISGFALGKSIFSHQTALALGAAYGTFAVPWQLGLTLDKSLLWSERMIVLISRIELAVLQLANREPVQDSILFILMMCVLFWSLAVHAGFSHVRFGSAWCSVLPAGLVIFLIHSLDAMVSRRSWYLAVYIFFSLVMVARMVYIQRQDRWQSSRTALPPRLGLDFIRLAIISVLVIIILSWTVPAIANSLPAAQRMYHPVQRLWNKTRDHLDNAFASLRTSVGVVSQYYGVSASLGRGAPLTDDHILTIRIPDDLPANIRLYWRARTYDTYDMGQWFSTIHTAYQFNPETDQLPSSDETGRWLGTFNIISAVHLSTLSIPPQPVWTDQIGQVEYAMNPDGSLDISTFRAVPSIDPGEVYQAKASLSYATELQLNNAGTNYPTWVTERYLALPETVTPRTHQLAADITADLETPYEKVAAITDYLRKNIEYSETIEAELPNNQDLIDWFLFDYKKGFCNYYATAEVILLRSIGIPARWAVGYAEGERISADDEADRSNRFSGGSIIVRQRDAHAWPEVYFPGIGWVEFEPTNSQPNILRLPGNSAGGLSSSPTSDSPDLETLLRGMEEEMALMRQQHMSTETFENQAPESREAVYWIAGLAVIAMVIYIAYRNRKRIKFPPLPILIEKAYLQAGLQPPLLVRKWAFQATLPPLAKAYQEINKALARLGKKPLETQTPAERARSLTELVPEISQPACALVHEYEKETFGRQHANLVIATRSASDIRRLSSHTSLKGILQRFPVTAKILRIAKHDVESQV